MQIEVIDKKQFIFRINNEEYTYIKPKTLMKNFGVFIIAKVKGSTMGWYIQNDFLSYQQFKKTFQKNI